MRQLKISKSITKRESESISSYFSEVSQLPLITEKEEFELFQEVGKGSEKAFKKVIESNLRFVISVAKQYQNQGISLEDLINEGNIGLIKAARKFDNSRGFKFISYAVWWIRQTVMQAIAEHSRLIRLPNNHINSINKINKIGSKLEQSLEREPTQYELEMALEGLDVKVKDSMSLIVKMSSLDSPLKEGEEMYMYDILENKNAPMPDNAFIHESMLNDIEKVLKNINGRQRTIICMYYGLMGFQQMTLEEIGEYFELTRERVRQIKDSTIRLLKNHKNSKILKEHI